MGLFDLKNVRGRDTRRKQSKVGRFNTDHLNSSKGNAEYDFPKISEIELKKLKNNINEDLKKERRKSRIKIALITFLIVYLLYYFKVFEYFNRYFF